MNNLLVLLRNVHRALLYVAVCLTILLFLCAGCKKSTSDDGNLPKVITLGSCMEKYPAPSGCVWAQSMDAIVWGTLTKIRAVELPALDVNSSDGPKWVETCSGAINIALELEIDVERTLYGQVEGRVLVRIGNDQVNSFDPLPEVSSGGLIWTHHGIPASGGLVMGDKIGLPIHWMDEDQLWSLMGEIMFIVRPYKDGKEAILFQEVEGDCRPRVPQDVPGLSLDEFSALVASCPSSITSEAQERKEQMINLWGTRPESYMAPVCIIIPQDGGMESCKSDNDCGEKEYCDLTVNECKCLPQCDGKCGGPDGCGGNCTDICPAGQTCQAPDYTTCS